MASCMRITRVVAVFLSVVFLSACGGGGGSAGSSDPPNVLFAVDIAHSAIGAFPTLNPAAGSSVSGHVISGVNHLGHGLAYDAARDELYAIAADRIVVFAHASTAGAGATPSRSITPPAGFVWMSSLYLDRTNDRLYVGGGRTYDGQIVVFAHASTASGAVVPERTMTINEGVNYFAIDPVKSMLYVVNSVVGVHVYANSDTATGLLQQTRGINVSGGNGVAVDPLRDRVYVSDVFHGVHLITQASTASPTIAGTMVLANAQFVTLDAANDRLYVGAYDKAYIFNQASLLGPGSSPAAGVALLAPSGSSVAAFAFP